MSSDVSALGLSEKRDPVATVSIKGLHPFPAHNSKIDMEALIHDCLKPYRELVAIVDRLLDDVRRKYPSDIACHKGCNCGCRNLSIFPIEALSIFMAIRQMPPKAAAAILQRTEAHRFQDCPLLQDRTCGLYPFRPIICRTHGLPLQTIYRGRPSIGYCRRNFVNRPAIPRDAVIDLDWINNALRTVNAALAQHLSRQMPARLSIQAAVQLRLR